MRRVIPPVAVLFVAILTACTAGSDEATIRPDDLLVLAGETGDAELRAWFAGEDRERGEVVGTPDEIAWVAAGRADVLVAGLGDGTLWVSDPIEAGADPTWREPAAVNVTGDPAEGPFYFPMWDPEGGRIAALAGDLDVAPRLTLIDPSTETAFEIDLGRPVAAAPPAWVGPDLVAVLAGTTEAPTAILVDTTTGGIETAPPGARLLAASADGEALATAGADGDPVVIRTTEGWLSGDGSAIGSIDPPSDALAPTALALDRDAERLAIAWLMDGGTIEIAVHERASGWRRVAEPDVGQAIGAVVAWLR